MYPLKGRNRLEKSRWQGVTGYSCLGYSFSERREQEHLRVHKFSRQWLRASSGQVISVGMFLKLDGDSKASSLALTPGSRCVPGVQVDMEYMFDRYSINDVQLFYQDRKENTNETRHHPCVERRSVSLELE